MVDSGWVDVKEVLILGAALEVVLEDLGEDVVFVLVDEAAKLPVKVQFEQAKGTLYPTRFVIFPTTLRLSCTVLKVTECAVPFAST